MSETHTEVLRRTLPALYSWLCFRANIPLEEIEVFCLHGPQLLSALNALVDQNEKMRDDIVSMAAALNELIDAARGLQTTRIPQKIYPSYR